MEQIFFFIISNQKLIKKIFYNLRRKNDSIFSLIEDLTEEKKVSKRFFVGVGLF